MSQRTQLLRIDQFRAECESWSLPDQDDLLAEYRDLIQVGEHSLERARAQGHFTASALLVDPTARLVMLLMHPKVGRWLQFGGHIEPGDDSFVAAALRECTEESGYDSTQITGPPLAIDRHLVRCAGGISVHWDVQFLATVDRSSPRFTTEDLQTRWFAFGHEVAGVTPGLDVSVQRLISAAERRCYPH